MGTKIVIAFFTMSIILSGVFGYRVTVKADNDKYYYSFYNANSSGNTAAKTKTTNKKVYIHQVSGPATKYTVQGSISGSTWNNRSSQKLIYSETRVRVSNTVHENNEHRARLHIVSTGYAPIYTTGYWDPDPS
ncbi:MAG: hypothetical protein J5767_13105 [Paludibacteraceae bacterium]|nr:hypothetical protein [Paludibacteraceae bacterium]